LKNRRLVLAARPQGLIKQTDLQMEEVDIPALKEGEFLIKTKFLSLAPVMKFYMIDGAGIEEPLPLGGTMRGRGVGEVIDSKNSNFHSGDIVHGKFGWQEYVISDGSPERMMYKANTLGLSPSTALGILGMTGYTSYIGLYKIGQLKEGDNVLVSSAAGGVGSILGGLAKIKGANVVGMTSKDEKCKLLTQKLQYDAAINYRNGDLSNQIKEAMPNGVDVYFDNAGGAILDAALAHVNRYARVVCCGRISTYKDKGLKEKHGYALGNWHMIHAMRASMLGFFIYDYAKYFEEARINMAEWIKEGKLHYHEDILEGLEKMPEALNRLFEGKNVGKQLVKIN
jgi:NADPH-dependent curcumin reductase CurA